MSDTEALHNAGTDADAPPTDAAFWADAELKGPEPCMVPVYIRIKPDVLDFFKQGGPGYQRRINHVLEAYVNHHRKRAAS